MKKSAFISDILFTFLLVGVFTLCFFRYLGLTIVGSFILASLCGALAAGGVGAILQSKRARFFLKRSDESQKQKFLLHLSLISDERITQFFQKLFSEELPKRLGKLRLATKNAFYFLSFRFAPVSADDAAAFSRLKTAGKKILLCNQIDEAALQLCQRLQIEVRTGEQVYAMVKAKDALPDTYAGEETPVDKKQRRQRLCFSKSNAKRFLVGGALVLLTSLITPFPYYYLTFGSLLLLVAALIRFLGY
ncbi:MAG: hypothetical protein IJA89_05155 [Clostridia bacterium]|nr:hypothetical protein [Clostridia bacterium]